MHRLQNKADFTAEEQLKANVYRAERYLKKANEVRELRARGFTSIAA